MMRTTGVLVFDSGYTTNVSTERPSCLTLTHSRCRGDFSSLALAQSCAETACAVTNRRINEMYFIVVPPLSAKVEFITEGMNRARSGKKSPGSYRFERAWDADHPHPPVFCKKNP